MVESRRSLLILKGCGRPTKVAVNLRRRSIVPHERRISMPRYDEVFGDCCHRQQSPENLWNFGAKSAILAMVNFCTDGTAYPSRSLRNADDFRTPLSSTRLIGPENAMTGSLSSDIIDCVFTSLPDLTTLLSTVLVSKSFHEVFQARPSSILTSVAKTQIGPELLP